MQAQTSLATEMGRQQIAVQDLELIANDSLFGGSPLSDDERQLVLRKPQLNAVKPLLQQQKQQKNKPNLIWAEPL
ncbi:hypothetical protein Q2T40_05150 [Winogradskyella maritima]|nr:hypothetical protein [Winogradskyella maritima]